MPRAFIAYPAGVVGVAEWALDINDQSVFQFEQIGALLRPRS